MLLKNIRTHGVFYRDQKINGYIVGKSKEEN